jgi:hypothetical protein
VRQYYCSVRKWSILVAAILMCVVLGGCGGGATSTRSPPRYTVSDAEVCKAFNTAASPLEEPISVEIRFVKLAASAKNADLRQEGKALLRDYGPGEGRGSKPFFDIGSICVAEGLTPKDWSELI